jgi:hypothetical protein
MAKLKITRANGEVSEHKITPGVEYAFELREKMGISKALRDRRNAIHNLLVSVGMFTQG